MLFFIDLLSDLLLFGLILRFFGLLSHFLSNVARYALLVLLFGFIWNFFRLFFNFVCFYLFYNLMILLNLHLLSWFLLNILFLLYFYLLISYLHIPFRQFLQDNHVKVSFFYHRKLFLRLNLIKKRTNSILLCSKYQIANLKLFPINKINKLLGFILRIRKHHV